MILSGDCQPCSKRSVLTLLDALAGSDIKVFVVHLQTPDQETKAAISAKSDAVFLSDPTGKIHKTLNAAFIPRVYVYDSNRRLIWKQNSPSIKEVADYAKGR